jgi:hypothetical protein
MGVLLRGTAFLLAGKPSGRTTLTVIDGILQTRLPKTHGVLARLSRFPAKYNTATVLPIKLIPLQVFRHGFRLYLVKPRLHIGKEIHHELDARLYDDKTTTEEIRSLSSA